MRLVGYLKRNLLLLLLLSSDQEQWDVAGHVECMGEKKRSYMISLGEPAGRDQLEDLVIQGM